MTQTLFDQLSEPVQELFLLGVEVARGRQWPDYLAFGITTEHIPELLRILRHFESFWYDDQYDDDQGLTPIHAWRALGQLRAKKAINTLLFLIHENEEYDSDWIGDEIPVVLGMIGPASIPGLKAYLNTPGKRQWAAISVAHSLEEVAKQHPERRADCIAVLQHALEDFLENDETLNGFLISFLVDLEAVESVPLPVRT